MIYDFPIIMIINTDRFDMTDSMAIHISGHRGEKEFHSVVRNDVEKMDFSDWANGVWSAGGGCAVYA